MNTENKNSNNLIKLPHGVSDFKELLEGNFCFIDKSPFIRDIVDNGAKVILITRPRRFGKTLNLSMLYHFLKQNDEQSKNLFKNLEISKDVEFCREHQNQYPIIFISFKDIKRVTHAESYNDIVELIRQLYEEHKYLLEDSILSGQEKNIFITILDKCADSIDVESAIEQLSKYITRKYNKNPIVLIDDYDAPIQEAYLNGYYKEMLELMYSILGRALKDNSCLDKAVMMGITKVPEESIFSGFDNIDGYSMLREQYGQYFGFTESEVIKLIEGTEHRTSLDSIREWYSGHQVGKYVLYNPWSIISCLNNHGILKPYWINTTNNDLIAKLLSSAKPIIRQQLKQLLQGKIIKLPLSENLIFPDIDIRKETLWSLLLYAGYLKALSSEFGSYLLMANVAIPNKEVTFAYDKIIKNSTYE